MQIKSAAISFIPMPYAQRAVVSAKTHKECYEEVKHDWGIYLEVAPEKYSLVEGFILDDHTFVDRIEAMKIAKENDMISELYMDDLVLFSYKIKEAKLNE